MSCLQRCMTSHVSAPNPPPLTSFHDACVSLISVVEASKQRHQEEQENKLAQSHRTISLPAGINQKQKQTNFYVNTPPTTPVAKMPSTSRDYSHPGTHTMILPQR